MTQITFVTRPRGTIFVMSMNKLYLISIVFAFCNVEDDVQGININDRTSKSQECVTIYLPIVCVFN